MEYVSVAMKFQQFMVMCCYPILSLSTLCFSQNFFFKVVIKSQLAASSQQPTAIMRGFEEALHCLRALVDTNLWDYSILWKSTYHSPSTRFLDWVGCCCSGALSDDTDPKKEAAEITLSTTLCKDTQVPHLRRTNACQALALFPSSISFNSSGVHGDALISNQPIWLTSGEVSSTSTFSHELTGTRVLIPISSGIVELFSTKHWPREGEVIEFVMAHCNFCMDAEKKVVDSEWPHDHHHPQPPFQLDFKSNLQILPSLSQSNSFPSNEGSSSASKPSTNDHHHHHHHNHFDSYSSLVSVHGFFNQSKNPMPPQQDNLLHKDEEEAKAGGGRQGNKVPKSKNLLTERRRRNKIKDRLYALRALVPNISKMDRAAIIVDAIDYIRELEENVKGLQNELHQMDHNDSLNNKHLNISPFEKKKDDTICCSLVQHDQPMFVLGEEKPMEVEVEVMQMNEKDFLIKLFCKRKQGGVLSSVEAMDSLGLQVVDVNITTFGSMVLNIFHVEANENDIQPKRLRDSLIKLTSRENRQLK